MKISTIISFLFVFVSFNLFAQPTVTSSIVGDVGDEFSFDILEVSGIYPGEAGEDVTWDFSDFVPTGMSNSYTLVDVVTTPYASDFPGANTASSAGGNYAYYNISSSVYEFYGAVTPLTLAYYDDPEELYVFPMTYGTTNTDDLHSEFTSGVDFERSGSNVLTVDGYGTLILPSGTYTDVLRVKLEQDYGDDAIGVPYELNYNYDLYYWVKEGVIGPLFEYFYQEVTGSLSSIIETALINTNITSGIHVYQNISSFNIAPNPANEKIILYADHEGYVSIFNMSGEKVLFERSAKYNEINITSLPEGNYLVTVNTDYGNSSKIMSVVH